MNRTIRLLLAVGGAFLLSALLALVAPGVFDIVGLRVLDAQFRIRYAVLGRQPVDPAVVQVDIDDASLRELPPAMGRAELVARLLEALRACGVSAVALDMVFADRAAGPADDELAAAVRESAAVYCPVVVRPAAPGGGAGGDGETGLPAQASWGLDRGFGRLRLQGGSTGFTSAAGIVDGARGAGHINAFPDADGVYRRIPLFLRVGSRFVPSLALRTACGYLGVESDRVETRGGRRIVLRGAAYPDGRQKDIVIPVDKAGRLLIDLPGPWADSFAHYPASRLLEASADPPLLEQLRDEMEGDLVVLSDVSSGGRDYGPSALEGYFPLSGLHAAAVSSILRAQFLRQDGPWAIAIAAASAAALFVLLALRFRGAPFLLLALAVFAVFLAGAASLFLFARIVVDVIVPGLGMVFAAAAVSFSTLLDQEREKAAFRARIERYFSPPLLKKILERPAMLEGCEKKVLTVLFSDISGFTTWSSRQGPEDIRGMLNEYFEQMAGIVFAREGTIDKYIGDGMLAFFGDPVEQADHAERAVRSAMDMQRTVSELRARWERAGGMPIAIRIGINTGEVVAGNMGSARRLDYTVIGSNVNLASRLESNARPGQILVSRATRDALPSSISLLPAGTITAKGFSDPVEVFSVGMG
jgi:adenylate cyclase